MFSQILCDILIELKGFSMKKLALAAAIVTAVSFTTIGVVHATGDHKKPVESQPVAPVETPQPGPTLETPTPAPVEPTPPAPAPIEALVIEETGTGRVVLNDDIPMK